MADPVVHLTNGIPDSGTGTITTLGQTLLDGANVTIGAKGDAPYADGTGTAAGSVTAMLKGSFVKLAAFATAATGIFSRITDGTNTAAVKAASTAPVATDPALVVTISPNGINQNGQTVMANCAPMVLPSNQSTLAIAQDTSQLLNGASGVSVAPQFQSISVSASGVTNVVSAVSGKKIRVVAWDLVVNAAVNFKWQSNNGTSQTDETGLYYMSGQGNGIARSFNPVGYFQTNVGEALALNLSGAVSVGGSLVYVTV